MTELRVSMNAVLFVLFSSLIVACTKGPSPATRNPSAVSSSELPDRLVDAGNLLSTEQKVLIVGKLRSIEQRSGMQVGVLLIPTTGTESIEAYSLRMANASHLGRKDVNDGVLIVIATQDHHLRLEIGTGLIDRIPDRSAAEIVAMMATRLKVADYYSAIIICLDEVVRRGVGPASVVSAHSERDAAADARTESIGRCADAALDEGNTDGQCAPTHTSMHA